MILNVCIAIDVSGSVCRSSGSLSNLCETCDSNCTTGGVASSCCGNFDLITSFASSFVDTSHSGNKF